MRIKVLVLALTYLMIYSCTVVPAPQEIAKTFPVEAPFDEVWSVVVELFTELNLPIIIIDKDSGFITTNWISFTGQKTPNYCDCGELGINIERSREGRFNVYVKRTSDNSCKVVFNCIYQQTLEAIRSTFIAKRNCVSTGKMEAIMIEFIKSKLE